MAKVSPMMKASLTTKVPSPAMQGGHGSSDAVTKYSGGGGFASMQNNSPYNSSNGQMSLTPMGGQSQQLLLAPPSNTQYYEAREQAVTEVEKTIHELGSLFKRLATMISEQQELVERIDEDVENAVSNADRGRDLLLKAYESASSNRGLYTKLGAILALFFLFFVIFLM